MTAQPAQSLPGPALSEPRYLPALDGLRAVAISWVLVSHFLPFGHRLNKAFHFGRLGVILFFVLSGFLITGILLGQRRSGPGRLGSLIPFYARRALRIFPIYFLTVSMAFAVGYGPIRTYIGWHLTYLSSPLGAFAGINFHSAVHLWSLCVEEQFYLVWPWVVLLVPADALGWVIGAMIAASVGYKAIGSLAGLSWEATNYTVFGCLDSLGIGALLAWCRHHPDRGHLVESRLVGIGISVGIPLSILLQLQRATSSIDARLLTSYRSVVDVAAALCFAALIGAAASPTLQPSLGPLTWRPLRWLGKISYGVYLYHLFLVPIGAWVATRAGWRTPAHGWAMLAGYSLLSVGVAACSWRWIERPLNQLKRLVPYGRVIEPEVTPPVASVAPSRSG